MVLGVQWLPNSGPCMFVYESSGVLLKKCKSLGDDSKSLEAGPGICIFKKLSEWFWCSHVQKLLLTLISRVNIQWMWLNGVSGMIVCERNN